MGGYVGSRVQSEVLIGEEVELLTDVTRPDGSGQIPQGSKGTVSALPRGLIVSLDTGGEMHKCEAEQCCIQASATVVFPELGGLAADISLRRLKFLKYDWSRISAETEQDDWP